MAGHRSRRNGFNSQPPEGGWHGWFCLCPCCLCFNSQPPEGGWVLTNGKRYKPFAGFNSQPPEGGWIVASFNQHYGQSFNSQPPEGGWFVQLRN